MNKKNRELILLEALRAIEKEVDNTNPSHENIWRIAFGAIEEFNDEVKKTGLLPSSETERQVLLDYLDWYENDIKLGDEVSVISEFLIDKFICLSDRSNMMCWINSKDNLPDAKFSKNGQWENKYLFLVKWVKHNSIEFAVLTKVDGKLVWEMPDKGFAELEDVVQWSKIPE